MAKKFHLTRLLMQAVMFSTCALMVNSVQAQADEARAKKIVGGSCFVCHGAEGESSSEVFPRLAGQHWEYIAKQLENFKNGKRVSMERINNSRWYESTASHLFTATTTARPLSKM